VRLELPLQLSPYVTLGRSSRTGDARSSWNQLAGVSIRRIRYMGLRADVRYSRFDSSFGRGSYRALSLSREIGEILRFDVQAGQQNFQSSLSRQNRAHWIHTAADVFVNVHYVLGAGLTVYRGEAQSYDQWFLSLAYRF
jgi:hypothetical protein